MVGLFIEHYYHQVIYTTNTIATVLLVLLQVVLLLVLLVLLLLLLVQRRLPLSRLFPACLDFHTTTITSLYMDEVVVQENINEQPWLVQQQQDSSTTSTHSLFGAMQQYENPNRLKTNGIKPMGAVSAFTMGNYHHQPKLIELPVLV